MEGVSAEQEVCCDIQLPEKQICLQRRQQQVYTGRLLADVRLVGAGVSRGEKKKNVCHLVVVVIVVCGGVRWAWGWGNYDSDQQHLTS